MLEKVDWALIFRVTSCENQLESFQFIDFLPDLFRFMVVTNQGLSVFDET